MNFPVENSNFPPPSVPTTHNAKRKQEVCLRVNAVNDKVEEKWRNVLLGEAGVDETAPSFPVGGIPWR